MQNQPNLTGRRTLTINITTAASKQTAAAADGQNDETLAKQTITKADTSPTQPESSNELKTPEQISEPNDQTSMTESTVADCPPATQQQSTSDAVDLNGRAPFYELTRCMMRLFSIDVGQLPSENSEAFRTLLSDLEYVQRCVELGSGKRPAYMVTRLIALGVVEMCQQLCRTLFSHKDFMSSTSGGVRQLAMLALGIGTTLTDGSRDACRRVLDIEFQKDLFAYLRSDSLDPAKVKYNNWRGYVTDCFLAILYNIIQALTEARELYRDEDAVRVFQRFRRNATESVSCMALILQAYVINEDENSVILDSEFSCFTYLADELRSTFEDPDEHRSRNGYRAVELLAALNKLAVADANKLPIVESGALDSYVRLIQSGGGGDAKGGPSWISSVDEQLLACMGLWTLASSCAEKLRDHPGCMDGLNSLLNTTSDDGIKRQASGAFQMLQEAGIKVTTECNETNNDAQERSQPTFSGASFGDQVFISYNHASKATVLRLRDRLKAAGFCVWVDEEGVFESIADDIIKGLDKASVVLACMTQKYYESPYCKKEVVYAAESYKKIIPLTLEPRYNPHGWLRFHTSDGLRYDFSSDDNFEDSFKKLSQTLRLVLNSSTEKTPEIGKSGTVQPQLVPDHQSSLRASPPATAAENGKAVKSWTAKEVTGWLNNNGLQHLSRWFNGFDGEMLLEYRAFRHGPPETQAACYHDERLQGRMSISDVIKLTRALKRL